jgi:hypothetical protein
MSYDPLLNKVVADYGKYFGVQGYAEGGNVPLHSANLSAYEEAVAKAKAAADAKALATKDQINYRPGIEVIREGDKYIQNIPPSEDYMKYRSNYEAYVNAYNQAQKDYSQKARTVLVLNTNEKQKPYINQGYTMIQAGPEYSRFREPFNLYFTQAEPTWTGPSGEARLEFAYNPALYEFGKEGQPVSKKPELFGGSLAGMSSPFAGLGGTMDPFKLGSALKMFKGGMVKGYANGGEFEEDPYSYAPMPAPQMQQTMTPNFMPLQSGQVEPSGGGYIPSVTPESNNSVLKAMLDQYTSGTDYSEDLRKVRTERKATEESFNNTLEKLMTGQDEGPSKAEMYFRLAAAFGAPTKTGHFGESLGQAAAALGDYTKEQRASQTSKRKLGAEIAMKKQELALESIKDTEKTLLGLQSEANKDKREFIKAQVKEYIDSGKPQSNAGKIAKDKGLIPGTKEYQEEVDKQVNLEIEKQVGAIRLQLQSGNIALANLGIAQEKAGREAIKLEPDERKAIRDDEDAMFAARATIKNMNTALGFIDQAFTNTAADQAQYKKLKQTNPNDPRVKATEELENLIGQNVVGSLKTTFGGNPTEGERRALQELGGLGSANKEVRRAIINRAMKALEEAADYRSARITKIETGGYRKKTEEK